MSTNPLPRPEFSRAAVMHAFNEPLVVESLPVPRTLGPGELLVRVELAGICGTDCHLHKGELDVPLPLVLGHETTGMRIRDSKCE